MPYKVTNMRHVRVLYGIQIKFALKRGARCVAGAEAGRWPEGWRVPERGLPGGGSGRLPHHAHLQAALWNPNYFLRFRFRLLRSYGSGSGSSSDFWHITVPDPVPYLVSRPLIAVFKQYFFFFLIFFLTTGNPKIYFRKTPLGNNEIY
jgi:hypothetical protein